MSNKSKRYTDEFKKQIVGLFNNGKPANEIVNEYKIDKSTLHKWVNDEQVSQQAVSLRALVLMNNI